MPCRARIIHTRCRTAIFPPPGTTHAAFDELFAALDWCEERLGRQRFLAGSQFTEADLRLFVTLIRFDPVYVGYFKCDKRLIRSEYPNLKAYISDIYQTPGMAASVDIQVWVGVVWWLSVPG